MDTLITILLFINMLFVAEAPLTDQSLRDFALKMEPYYAQAGIPTDTSNTSLHKLPETYWGATVWSGRCTKQVYLDERFAGREHPFYNTPMWKYVLAHEWAHVAQRDQCMDNEAEAQLIALAVLADAGEWGAVFTALEWMLALSAPDEVQNQLHLPAGEADYYRNVHLTQIAAVELLLNDDDGIFQLRTGHFNARVLWQFMQNLCINAEDIYVTGAR